MTDAPALGSGADLDFMAPLSAARADRLVAELVATDPRTVIDFGCGWGELLVRIVAKRPDATGAGIDSHGPDIARGRRHAAERGLADRITFVEGAAADHVGTANTVISIGAYQAFGTIPEALVALRARVEPAGRLLFGAEFWEQPPPPERLARMWPDATADDCLDLAGVVDAAIAAGFRPLRVETATRDEWAEFECGLAASSEEWLLANPEDAKAAEVRAALDSQRDSWLRGHLGYLGFAYLTLGVPR